MKIRMCVAVGSLMLLTLVGQAETGKAQTLDQMYPGLASSSLTYARVADLPADVLVRAGSLTITRSDLDKEIREVASQTDAEAGKYAFFILEQLANRKVFRLEAELELTRAKQDIKGKDEEALSKDYVEYLARDLKVSDADAQAFYTKNRDMFRDASFEQVQPHVRDFIIYERKQELVDQRIRTLGQRMPVEISAAFVKVQAAAVRETPVNKARSSGKPSLVVFSASSCCGKDRMRPIADDIRALFENQLTIIYIEARKQPLLAASCKVRSIPTILVFDKTGKEVVRHVGFLTQDDLKQMLSTVGVK